MDVILDEAKADESVKDLDFKFSSDGLVLIFLDHCGRSGVWYIISSKSVASLPKENDESFCGSRFSRAKTFMYSAAVTGGGIATWNATTWKKMNSRIIVCDRIIALLMPLLTKNSWRGL